MKTTLAKSILLILSLLCILCVPVTPVYGQSRVAYIAPYSAPLL